MNVAEFDFSLPDTAIAQRPAEPRDASRLLVAGRFAGEPRHLQFRDLPTLLRAGDLVVLNDTRVVPARLLGRRATGGRFEVLVIEPAEAAAGDGVWRCLGGGSRKPEVGESITFGEGLTGRMVGREGELFLIRLDAAGAPIPEALERAGRMPLPPYIRRRPEDGLEPSDRRSYQTVFARHDGSIAAPTAGLHFTPELLNGLRGAGVEIAQITLHVGIGTFRPVRVERVEDHPLVPERYVLGEDCARAVAQARRRGARVIAVGTTVVRTLETCAADDGTVVPGRGASGLFVVPGFRFRVVDGLITNFHLPRSTLLMLVAAFAGRERVLALYREALQRGYRFYSYGDAMFLE